MSLPVVRCFRQGLPGQRSCRGLSSLLAGGTGIRPGVFRRWAEAQPKTFFGMPLLWGGPWGHQGGCWAPKKRPQVKGAK